MQNQNEVGGYGWVTTIRGFQAGPWTAAGPRAKQERTVPGDGSGVRSGSKVGGERLSQALTGAVQAGFDTFCGGARNQGDLRVRFLLVFG